VSAVVLGLGNVLMLDDGVGAAAVVELGRRYRLPDEVALLDGGVLGLHLVGLLADADSVLVLDAVRAGGAPGTPTRLEGAAVHARYAARISPHEVGFTEVLATAAVHARSPRRLVVHGVEPEQVGPGVGLSAPVASALDRLVDAAAAELRAWGFDVRPLDAPAPAGPYPDGVLGLVAARSGA